MLEAALKYNELGFNVIVVGVDKKPLVKWEIYQKERSTPEQIKEWFSGSWQRNIALVTGEISNLLVVDCDTPSAMQEIQDFLPESIVTPIQRTPHGGKHFFFQH